MAEVMATGAAITEGVKNAKSAEEVLERHREYTKYAKTIHTLEAISSIRHSLDTRDEFYDKENDFFDENEPLLQKLNMDFYKALVGSPFRAELESSLGKLLFTNAELQPKGFAEKIIGDLQKENALCTRYDKLLASASFEFDGKKLNLPQLMAYAKSKDRDIRKAAYEKRTEFFTANEAEFNEIYDELVKLRDGMAKKLGYSSFTELGYIRMGRNCYDAATVKKFRDQVKNVLVPFLREMNEKRRKELDVEKLKYFDEDIYFADGNPKPKGTPDEMFAAGKKMYTELSSDTQEFIDYMLDNELFDVLAREGKSGGGYCSYIADYGSPFVFANFNGTSGDVDVLTHECGHALACYCARDTEIMEYMQYTSDMAEIHSMAMEFFVADWMELFFKDETQKYLYMHLMSSLDFLPYGCMVDEFQHLVYAKPEMTPDERKAVWMKLEEEYKPHLDYDGDPFFGKGGGWQRQLHIYRIPFYYIDYCLAQTCALQYRIWMETDKDAAWKSYFELLKKAGTRTFVDIVAEAGLVSPFESDCISKIITGAEKLLAELR